MIRLQKYLSQCGIGSRRAIEKLIQDGRITVNGSPVPLGHKVNPETDKICLDNQPILFTIPDKVYVLLNKPKGVVTTASDELGRLTVLDLVKKIKSRVFPVGRLDLDVEGALLLTNDGELANRLLHPSSEVPKTYIAVVKGFITIQAIKKLQSGVYLEDGKTSHAKVKVLSQSLTNSTIQITIHEGKKREVKRMCFAVGFPVLSLKRVSFAGISVNNLPPGKWRYLTADEIAHLKEIAQKYHQIKESQ